MRKLKLQMQVSVDGFVGGPNGELDWMTWDWDDGIKNYVDGLTDSVDTILLGRKMTEGFIGHWSNIKPDDPSYPFAQKMMGYKKIVFSKTLKEPAWENTNTRIANNNFKEEIKTLKNQSGKDIIVYGGASFVNSLVENNLIDEYYLFVNPAAIGNGLFIFKNRIDLKFINLISFDCGIVLLRYVPNS